ncbi:hypothetical protein EXS70_02750, partial [Candidatus Peribacteria bacterium]|nr:hypothetical protein [Candidatus Peribacteria bacterium]
MHIAHLDFRFVSRFRYTHTILWALLLSSLIVGTAATIARATVKLRGALTDDDGSIAVMMLLPDEGITDVELIKAGPETQEFLVETKEGPKLIRLKHSSTSSGQATWFVQDTIPLR